MRTIRRSLAVLVAAMLMTNVAFAQQAAQNAGTRAQEGGVGNQTAGGENQASQVESSAIQGLQQGAGGQGGGLGGQNALEGFFEQSGSSFFQAVAGAQNQRGGQAARTFNLGGFGGTGLQTGGTSSKIRQVRPSFRVAFPRSTSLSAPQVRTRVQARLQGLSQRVSSLRGVRIQTATDGQVVLTGQVASADARRLAANLVRIEPGVRKVKNELTVAAAAASNQ